MWSKIILKALALIDVVIVYHVNLEKQIYASNYIIYDHADFCERYSLLIWKTNLYQFMGIPQSLK